MLVQFCPACRAQNDWGAIVCHRCGMRLDSTDDAPYIQDLVWALQHPIQDIRLQAAYLLSRVGPAARMALPDLVRVFRATADVYLRAAIVSAVASLGAADGDALLVEALKDGSVIVRIRAAEAIGRKGDSLDPTVRARALGVLRRLAVGDTSQSVRELAQAAVTLLT